MTETQPINLDECPTEAELVAALDKIHAKIVFRVDVPLYTRRQLRALLEGLGIPTE